jgi:YesN/AraC family two-component response regulator
MDLEVRLMNAAKAGDLAEIERFLKHLWEENYEKRALSPEMLHLLTWEMRGTLVKLKNHLELNETIVNSIEKMNTGTKTFSEIFEEIGSIYKSICGYIDNQKRSHNINLKYKMIEFIDQAYQDAALSLSSVASKFALTESYISQFFKEQNGENFSSYLEKIRMQHACELLSDSDMPINEIAQRVGYYSDQVFRRAFKRFHGVTPNEFRLSSRSEKAL